MSSRKQRRNCQILEGWQNRNLSSRFRVGRQFCVVDFRLLGVELGNGPEQGRSQAQSAVGWDMSGAESAALGYRPSIENDEQNSRVDEAKGNSQ